MTQDWEDLRTILAMVRHGSLVRAGAALGVNYTTVARRIAQAEARYGAVLFDRLAQGYVPREVALQAAQQGEIMEQAEADFRLHLGGQDETLSGRLTLAAPEHLLASHLCGVIATFLQRHPQIKMDVRASGDLVNLNQREADLAIRISNSPGDTLIGHRLAHQQKRAFASRELAQRIAADPAQCIDWIGSDKWEGPPENANPAYPNTQLRLRLDNITAIIAAAQSGLGVVRLPVFLGRQAGLVPVDVLPVMPCADIWVVAHRNMWGAAKVAAFRTLLVTYFRDCRQDFIA